MSKGRAVRRTARAMRSHSARAVRFHTTPPEFGKVTQARPLPLLIELLTRGGGVSAADNRTSNMIVEEDQIILVADMLKYDRDHGIRKGDTLILEQIGGSWIVRGLVGDKHTFEGAATVHVGSDDLHIVAPALGGTCSIDHHIIAKAPFYDAAENVIGWIPIYEDLPGTSEIPDVVD